MEKNTWTHLLAAVGLKHRQAPPESNYLCRQQEKKKKTENITLIEIQCESISLQYPNTRL